MQELGRAGARLWALGSSSRGRHAGAAHRSFGMTISVSTLERSVSMPSDACARAARVGRAHALRAVDHTGRAPRTRGAAAWHVPKRGGAGAAPASAAGGLQSRRGR